MDSGQHVHSAVSEHQQQQPQQRECRSALMQRSCPNKTPLVKRMVHIGSTSLMAMRQTLQYSMHLQMLVAQHVVECMSLSVCGISPNHDHSAVLHLALGRTLPGICACTNCCCMRKNCLVYGTHLFVFQGVCNRIVAALRNRINNTLHSLTSSRQTIDCRSCTMVRVPYRLAPEAAPGCVAVSQQTPATQLYLQHPAAQHTGCHSP